MNRVTYFITSLIRTKEGIFDAFESMAKIKRYDDELKNLSLTLTT
ncbi:hypothetical protein [Lactococcus lactis]|nr:hypothetical protein [Lactococcus lactis]KST95082.1 hypothetical protein LKF67_0212 [Lactococcus lactis subsp. lactis]KSU15066.1 hypothetical protein LMG9446_0829 [Lactococcus lactis subsp. lactis]MDG4955176.1 hypothetical protein [Lactococcus lactis]